MGDWRQEYKEIQVASGVGVTLDINSADDTVFASLNGDIVGTVGLRGARTLNENLAPSLQTGGNVLVVSLYNDNRSGVIINGATGEVSGIEESPASMDASLNVGADKHNLAYATPGDHAPGLVSQYVFLLNKQA